jgi:hypothetical protein
MNRSWVIAVLAAVLLTSCATITLPRASAEVTTKENMECKPAHYLNCIAQLRLYLKWTGDFF